MVEIDAEAIAAFLVEQGARRDLARQYADLFCEYRAASANILEHGAIVLHPRTGNPVTNPYLVVRDRALARLARMRSVKGIEALWQ